MSWGNRQGDYNFKFFDDIPRIEKSIHKVETGPNDPSGFRNWQKGFGAMQFIKRVQITEAVTYGKTGTGKLEVMTVDMSSLSPPYTWARSVVSPERDLTIICTALTSGTQLAVGAHVICVWCCIGVYDAFAGDCPTAVTGGCGSFSFVAKKAPSDSIFEHFGA
jgi:hypothetical protein